MKKRFAMALCLCMMFTMCANAFDSKQMWEQVMEWMIPEDIEVYAAGKIEKEGRVYWSAERKTDEYDPIYGDVYRFCIHSMDLQSGEIETYDIPGYPVRTDVDGVVAAVQDYLTTTLYCLLPDGSTEKLRTVRTMPGLATMLHTESFILAYFKGKLYCTSRYAYTSDDNHRYISERLIQIDAEGNQYIYQLKPGADRNCISEDGLFARRNSLDYYAMDKNQLDPEKNGILIEDPSDGSIRKFEIADVPNWGCTAWVDSETVLFVGYEDGERFLYKLNTNTGACEKVLTKDENAICHGNYFQNQCSLDISNNMLAFLCPSGDESSAYDFPMVADLDTGKMYIVGHPIEDENGEIEMISKGNRVVFWK